MSSRLRFMHCSASSLWEDADQQVYGICLYDDVIKWEHFPRYWPFVRGIHRSPMNFHNKGQWRRALMFSLIGAWINAWVNNRKADDLRRHRAHYDVIVMANWDTAICVMFCMFYKQHTLFHKHLYIFDIYVYGQQMKPVVRRQISSSVSCSCMFYALILFYQLM